MSTGAVVLEQFLFNEQFTRKVIPYFKEEYFEEKEHQIVFKLINDFIQKYSSSPSKAELQLEIENLKLGQKPHDDVTSFLKGLEKKNVDQDWLLETSEKWLKKRALYLALLDAIETYNDPAKPDGQMNKTIEEAQLVGFDHRIGHDYFEDAEYRYELYHRPEGKVKFNINILNKITKGGVSKKSLNVFMGGLGVGKTMVMCSCAAANVLAGYNVLYISLEMAEAGDPSISQRIEANIIDVPIDQILSIPKDVFLSKVAKAKEKTTGKLIVREYPAGNASAATFKALLQELKLKKKFKPDIIYVDYLNLCASTRVKIGNSVNTYYYVKCVAEELRAIAQEYDLPIVSATQTNRDGLDNSDVGLENTADSIGLPQTVDLFLAVMQPEEMAALNQVLFKQLKNRYSNYRNDNRFVVGIDMPKMRLYDVEQSAQRENVVDDRPVMDKGAFNERMENDTAPLKKKKKKVGGFK